MDYLLEAFFRTLDNYKKYLNYTKVKNSDGTYSVTFFDIEPELDVQLVRAKIEIVESYEKHLDFDGILIGKTPNITENYLGIADKSLFGKKVFIVHLSKEDFAVKINKIDSIIRKYIESVCNKSNI